MDKLLQEVEALRSEVGELRGRTSTMAAPAESAHIGSRGIFSGIGPGEMRQGISKMVAVDQRGQKVPTLLLRQYPRRFGPESRVRLNPDSAKAGWGDGRTWRSVLNDAVAKKLIRGEVDPEHFFGVVEKVDHLADDGQWQYRASFPGLGQDGFSDAELLHP